MTDLFEALKTTVTERILNPLVGAFTVSWLILNYRAVVVLLSDLNPSEKFTAIDGLYIDGAARGIVWPAVLALIYTVCSPVVTWVVSHWSLWWANKINDMKLAAFNKQSISREDAETEQEAIIDERDKWRERYNESHSSMESLRVKALDLEQRLKIATDHKEQYESELNQTNKHVQVLRGELDSAQHECLALNEKIANFQHQNELTQQAIINARESGNQKLVAVLNDLSSDLLRLKAEVQPLLSEFIPPEKRRLALGRFEGLVDQVEMRVRNARNS